VRLHVEQPQLGAGQLRRLAFRVLGFAAARETIRCILIRNQNLIAELEETKRKPPRKIHVVRSRERWGADLTLLWILGFFPVWVLGVVDYHGSRLRRLSRWQPSSAAVIRRARAFWPRRPNGILTDRLRLSIRCLQAFLIARRRHTITRPVHPWTNGRIERVFQTVKQTIRHCRCFEPRSRRADTVSFYSTPRAVTTDDSDRSTRSTGMRRPRNAFPSSTDVFSGGDFRTRAGEDRSGAGS
jgi:hypothetical protein